MSFFIFFFLLIEAIASGECPTTNFKIAKQTISVLMLNVSKDHPFVISPSYKTNELPSPDFKTCKNDFFIAYFEKDNKKRCIASSNVKENQVPTEDGCIISFGGIPFSFRLEIKCNYNLPKEELIVAPNAIVSMDSSKNVMLLNAESKEVCGSGPPPTTTTLPPLDPKCRTVYDPVFPTINTGTTDYVWSISLMKLNRLPPPNKKFCDKESYIAQFDVVSPNCLETADERIGYPTPVEFGCNYTFKGNGITIGVILECDFDAPDDNKPIMKNTAVRDFDLKIMYLSGRSRGACGDMKPTEMSGTKVIVTTTLTQEILIKEIKKIVSSSIAIKCPYNMAEVERNCTIIFTIQSDAEKFAKEVNKGAIPGITKAYYVSPNSSPSENGDKKKTSLIIGVSIAIVFIIIAIVVVVVIVIRIRSSPHRSTAGEDGDRYFPVDKEAVVNDTPLITDPSPATPDTSKE